MELIRSCDMKVLSNPGVKSLQVINPGNSESKRVTITCVTVEPGAEQFRHSHESAEQIWVALKGRAALLLADDEEMVFSEGDAVRFSENDIHGLRNSGDGPFSYIAVTSPPLDFSGAYGDKK